MTIPSSFLIADHEVHRPTTVAQAHDLARSHGGEFVAGGLEVIAARKAGGAGRPLISLRDVEAMRDIRVDQTNGRLVIGAGVTHEELMSSREVREALPGLCSAYESLGSPRIRAQGTLGGNVVADRLHGMTYDVVPLLTSLDATTTLFDGSSTAEVPIAELVDRWRPATLLTSIRVRLTPPADVVADMRHRPRLAVALCLRGRTAVRCVCWGSALDAGHQPRLAEAEWGRTAARDAVSQLASAIMADPAFGSLASVWQARLQRAIRHALEQLLA